MVKTDYAKLFFKSLSFWSKLPFDEKEWPRNIFTAIILGEALNFCLVSAGIRSCVLIDYEIWGEGGIFNIAYDDHYDKLVEKHRKIAPSHLSFTSMEQGILICNDRIRDPKLNLKITTEKDYGIALDYACAGELGQEKNIYMVEIFGISKWDDEVPIITQACREYLSKIDEFDRQVKKIALFVKKYRLPFDDIGLKII